MRDGTFNTAMRAIAMTGLPGMLRRLRPEPGACVLMFHGFTEAAEEEGIGNASGLHLEVEVFEAMCQLLAERYTVLPLSEVGAALREGKKLPPRTVVLTFDDGYRSNYELAFPLLERYGLPATVFVATQFVHERVALWPDRVEYAVGHTEAETLRYPLDGEDVVFEIGTTEQRRKVAEDLTGVLKMVPQEFLGEQVAKIEASLGCALGVVPEAMPAIYRPLEWWQVRKMAASGLVEIGGHTHHHVILGRCQDDQVATELEVNGALLKEHGGIEPRVFAYPNGQAGDHNGSTREALLRAGYECAVTTEPGFNGAGVDVMRMNRFGTWNSATYVDVVASGTLKFLKEARGKLTRRAALA